MLLLSLSQWSVGRSVGRSVGSSVPPSIDQSVSEFLIDQLANFNKSVYPSDRCQSTSQFTQAYNWLQVNQSV